MDHVKLVISSLFLSCHNFGDIAAFTDCVPYAHAVAGASTTLPTPSKAGLHAEAGAQPPAGLAEVQAAEVTERGNSVVQALEHQLAEFSLTAGAHFVFTFLLWWLVHGVNSQERNAAARPLQRCCARRLITLSEPKLGGLLCSV